MRSKKMSYAGAWVYLILLLMGSGLSACYEPVEGCLNPRATNFDLDADEACSGCCTFPELSVQFTHVWDTGDTVFELRRDTFYHDVAGNPFRIDQVLFYGSGWTLETVASGELRVRDSLDLLIRRAAMDTTTITVVDDFVLASSRNSATYPLGSIEPTGLLSGLRWRFGLEEAVNRTFAGTLDVEHPLAPQLENLNYGPETGYVFAQFTLYRDTVATDTVPIVVNVFGNASSSELRLPLDPVESLLEGFNPLLTVQVDYASWLADANIRTADTTELKSIFVTNLTNAFELEDLSNR